MRRLEGDAKSQLRPVAIAAAILQHFEPGFRTVVGRKLQATYRTAPKTTRFSQNSTRNYRSGGIRDLQQVSTAYTGKIFLIPPGATGVLATWTPDLHTYYAITQAPRSFSHRPRSRIRTPRSTPMNVDTHLHNTRQGGFFAGWRMASRNRLTFVPPCHRRNQQSRTKRMPNAGLGDSPSSRNSFCQKASSCIALMFLKL